MAGLSVADLWCLWTCDDPAFEAFLERVGVEKVERIREARGA